jgi:hypothetical protein
LGTAWVQEVALCMNASIEKSLSMQCNRDSKLLPGWREPPLTERLSGSANRSVHHP